MPCCCRSEPPAQVRAPRRAGSHGLRSPPRAVLLPLDPVPWPACTPRAGLPARCSGTSQLVLAASRRESP
nr:unnamed protein product [Digitaria exilis]